MPIGCAEVIMLNPFYEKVYAIVDQIPRGSVASYGQIAWMLGHPRSAREVGRALRNCPENLPCHRVVLSDGTISKGGNAGIRKALLESEGVVFLFEDRVDMKSCRWVFSGIAPRGSTSSQ